ncbi:MAG: hypothetical protein ACPIOQ_62800 [Promethearchaeia archaeon]
MASSWGQNGAYGQPQQPSNPYAGNAYGQQQQQQQQQQQVITKWPA